MGWLKNGEKTHRRACNNNNSKKITPFFKKKIVTTEPYEKRDALRVGLETGRKRWQANGNHRDRKKTRMGQGGGQFP